MMDTEHMTVEDLEPQRKKVEEGRREPVSHETSKIFEEMEYPNTSALIREAEDRGAWGDFFLGSMIISAVGCNLKFDEDLTDALKQVGHPYLMARVMIDYINSALTSIYDGNSVFSGSFRHSRDFSKRRELIPNIFSEFYREYYNMREFEGMIIKQACESICNDTRYRVFNGLASMLAGQGIPDVSEDGVRDLVEGDLEIIAESFIRACMLSSPMNGSTKNAHFRRVGEMVMEYGVKPVLERYADEFRAEGHAIVPEKLWHIAAEHTMDAFLDTMDTYTMNFDA